MAEPVRAEVDGVAEVTAALGRFAARAGRTAVSVSVIYDTPYAIFVHEDLTKHHPVGQAKFLEAPSRSRAQDMARAAAAAWKAGQTWPQCLRAAAQVLLEASQQLVPVDTGLLKASGKVID